MTPPGEESVPSLGDTSRLEELGLRPEEAFVLSRVNGKSSLREIAQILGYDVAGVWNVLERLAAAGVVRIGERAGKAAPKKAGKKRPSILDRLDAEENDPHLKKIPREKRREILMRHDGLALQSHYEVLGVAQAASQDSIRKAYFRLVKEFHPDRYFGMELGHYRARLEAIFGRATQALELLADPARRKAYDRSLDGKAETGREGPPPEKEPGRGKPGTLMERLASAKRYFEMGKQAELSGKEQSAATFYQLAAELDARNAEYRKNRDRLRPLIDRKKAGDLYRSGAEALVRGDPGVATACFEEALALDPRKKECYRELAVLYVGHRSQLARAKELALQALHFYPDDAKLHACMGRIYQGLGELSLAKKEYKVARKLDGTNEWARRGLEELGGE